MDLAIFIHTTSKYYVVSKTRRQEMLQTQEISFWQLWKLIDVWHILSSTAQPTTLVLHILQGNEKVKDISLFMNKVLLKWWLIRDHSFKTSVNFLQFLTPIPSVVFYYYLSANLANSWPLPAKKCRRLKWMMVPKVFSCLGKYMLIDENLWDTTVLNIVSPPWRSW